METPTEEQLKQEMREAAKTPGVNEAAEALARAEAAIEELKAGRIIDGADLLQASLEAALACHTVSYLAANPDKREDLRRGLKLGVEQCGKALVKALGDDGPFDSAGSATMVTAAYADMAALTPSLACMLALDEAAWVKQS